MRFAMPPKRLVESKITRDLMRIDKRHNMLKAELTRLNAQHRVLSEKKRALEHRKARQEYARIHASLAKQQKPLGANWSRWAPRALARDVQGMLHAVHSELPCPPSGIRFHFRPPSVQLVLSSTDMQEG